MATSPKVVSSTSNAEMRKIKKPLIERKRRERINHSLAELKLLVLEARNKDESCYSKMEKADILEMTVEHLRELQAKSRRPDCDGNIPTDSRNIFHSRMNEVTEELPMPDMGLLMIASGRQPISSSSSSSSSTSTSTASSQHLLLGYSQCIQRVAECLESLNLKDSLRHSLIKHLQSNLLAKASSEKFSRKMTNVHSHRRHKNRKSGVPDDIVGYRYCDRISIQNDQISESHEFVQGQNSHPGQFLSSFTVWRPWSNL